MDPDACLARLLDAVADRDRDELLWAAADLATWLRRGGFPPRIPTRPVDPALRRLVAAACRGDHRRLLPAARAVAARLHTAP